MQGIFGKSRTVREHYRALLAKIEYEEKIGLLVSRREVEEVQFTTGRVVRDHFMMKAQIIGEDLAAQVGADKRAAVLAVRKHVKDALHELSRELREVSRIELQRGADTDKAVKREFRLNDDRP